METFQKALACLSTGHPAGRTALVLGSLEDLALLRPACSSSVRLWKLEDWRGRKGGREGKASGRGFERGGEESK